MIRRIFNKFIKNYSIKEKFQEKVKDLSDLATLKLTTG